MDRGASTLRSGASQDTRLAQDQSPEEDLPVWPSALSQVHAISRIAGTMDCSHQRRGHRGRWRVSSRTEGASLANGPYCPVHKPSRRGLQKHSVSNSPEVSPLTHLTRATGKAGGARVLRGGISWMTGLARIRYAPDRRVQDPLLPAQIRFAMRMVPDPRRTGRRGNGGKVPCVSTVPPGLFTAPSGTPAARRGRHYSITLQLI